MLIYILKLLILLPLIAGLAWGTLKLAQKMPTRLGAAQGTGKAVRIVETTMLSPTLKLVVIEFHGREILVSAGEILVIPAWVEHEATAIEHTVGVDIFSPIRRDWLDGSDSYFHNKPQEK